jgi:uncharacterized protein YdbL (DUF1318 family)
MPGRRGAWETLSGYLAPIQQDAETLALVNRINAAHGKLPEAG